VDGHYEVDPMSDAILRDDPFFVPFTIFSIAVMPSTVCSMETSA